MLPKFTKTTRNGFSCTAAKKADSTLVVAAAATTVLPRTLSLGFAVAIGLSSFLYCAWFITPQNLYFTVAIALDYIAQVDRLDDGVEAGLHDYSPEMLREVLYRLEPLIRIHEEIFERLVPYIHELYLQHSPLYEPLNELFEEWRVVGMNIMRTYRVVEGLLGISRDASRIPTLLFED